MKKTEIALASFALLSIVLKVLSVTGSTMFFTLSTLVLALFYLLCSFLLFNRIKIKDIFIREGYIQAGWERILWSILIGVILFVTLMGLMFVFNHWEGASLILKLGLLVMIPITCTSLIAFLMKSSRFHLDILWRCGIFLLGNILAMFLVTY